MKTEFNFESIPFSAKYYGTRIIDGGEHNAWIVKVHGVKFPFKVGMGRVDKRGNPLAPDTKTVMYCLLSYMRAGELPFEEFCSVLSSAMTRNPEKHTPCGNGARTLP